MYGHEHDERGGSLRITRTEPRSQSHNSRPQPRIQSPTHISTLDFDDDDMVMSTRPNVDDDLRRARFPPGRFSSDESDQHSEASSPRQHALSDNDCHILSDDDSLEIEVGRGGLSRSARPTPSKLRQTLGTSDILLDMGNSSLYGVTATPPPRSKPTRKSNGLDSGSLRRDAQLRRASGRLNDGSTMDFTSNKRHERHSSLPQNLGGEAHQSPRAGAVNATASSDFEIPQVNNMTELFAPDTQEQQMVPSSTRSRKQHLMAKRRSQAQDYMSIHGVPLPQDEQLIINGLEELRMKLFREQKRREEAEQKLAACKQENHSLRAEHQKLESYREEVLMLRDELGTKRLGRDSALGSPEPEPVDTRGTRNRDQLQIENAKLRTRVKVLQSTLDSEVQSHQETKQELKRAIDALKHSQQGAPQNEQLQRENDDLRGRIDDLTKQIGQLEDQLDNTRERHDDETQHLSRKILDLNQQVVDGDTAMNVVNRKYEEDLAKAKTTYEKEVRRLRREAEAQYAADRAAKEEYARLQEEHDKLLADLEDARARRERNMNRWEPKEAELKIRLGSKTKDVQSVINDAFRKHNEQIRDELAKVAAETNSGKRKESGAESRLRSRSRSITKAKASTSKIRRLSMAEAEAQGVSSDVESTTDLSEVLRAKSAKQPNRKFGARQAEHVDADTELSLPDTDEMHNIRKRVEEEHRAKKNLAAAPSLSRKSSMRSMHTRSSIGGDEHSLRSLRSTATGAIDDDGASNGNDTHASHASRSSVRSQRRRPSGAGADMTSGFLLPDLTLGGAAIATAAAAQHGEPPHDPARCTVCRRIELARHPTVPLSPLAPPTPVPASARAATGDDQADGTTTGGAAPDSTARPSEAPARALARVIQELGDEIAHLKLALRDAERALAAHDPAAGRRRREELEARVVALVRALGVRGDQIYALFDVLEGQRAAVGAGAEEGEREKRRVTVVSPEGEAGVEESEAEWEGCSVTGSMRIESILKSIRA